MSAICQTFTQNAWRKDLCSNCFKSKEEHERSDTTADVIPPSAPEASTRRYVGVSDGTTFLRSYYGRSSDTWRSVTDGKDRLSQYTFNTEKSLKSPSLIKELSPISSRVKLENKKNLTLSDLCANIETHLPEPTPKPKIAFNKSEYLGDISYYKKIYHKPDESICSSKSSSSHEDSPDLYDELKNTDENRINELKTELVDQQVSEGKSDNDKRTPTAPPRHQLKSDDQQTRTEVFNSSKSDKNNNNSLNTKESKLNEVPSNAIEVSKSVRPSSLNLSKPNSKIPPVTKIEKSELTPTNPPGILKSETNKIVKGLSLTFDSKDHHIGYGGDVDYSSDEDDDYESSDDDSICSDDLSPDERLLKRLTDKNTDFNSEIDNFSLSNPLQKKSILSEEVENNVNHNLETSLTYDDKHSENGKIKLKRSPPLVTVKPFISRGGSSGMSSSIMEHPRVNPVYPMKNGEIIRNTNTIIEEIPMKGIKPKFVSQEDEMVEKSYSDDEIYSGKSTKITSIDDEPSIKEEKITSIDDVQAKVKFTSIDDILDNLPVSEVDERNGERIENQNEAKTLITQNSSSPISSKANTSKVNNSNGIEKERNLAMVRSSVVPISNSVCQRRNSFMESQLGIQQTSENNQSVNSKEVCAISSVSSQNSCNNSDSGDDPSNLSDISKDTCSRKSSTSSQMTTFGTPVVQDLSSPEDTPSNTGFIDGKLNSVYESASDFLKDIKAPPLVVPPTASIQKSALYASTSCLKGLPNSKPVITPKPPILKDKPKLPSKQNTRKSLSSQPVQYRKKGISSSVSVPNLSTSKSNDTYTKSTDISNSLDSLDQKDTKLENQTHKTPPPTCVAPSLPKCNEEVVYDVPIVLKASFEDEKEPIINEDQIIYHEIGENICGNISSERQGSTRGQSRNTFEANRQLLSSALFSGGQNKRNAPPPPKEPTKPEESPKIIKQTSPKALNQIQNSPIYQGETKNSPRAPSENQRILNQNYPKEIAKEENITLLSYNTTKQSEITVIQNTTKQNPTNQTELHSTSQNPSSSHNTSVHHLTQPITHHPEADTHDVDSFSSFTDNDDDDEDMITNNNTVDESFLKRSQRSSSVIGVHRSSPEESYYDPARNSPDGGKMGATRSQSVPRTWDLLVNPIQNEGARKTRSRFGGFVKSSLLFRPSSPSSAKSSDRDRGRDRTKKSALVSLKKKFLKLTGSKDDSKRKVSVREQKEVERERRKSRLQIIHPIDYNQSGVEVIARPEKTSPIYDFAGAYAALPYEQKQSDLQTIETEQQRSDMMNEYLKNDLVKDYVTNHSNFVKNQNLTKTSVEKMQDNSYSFTSSSNYTGKSYQKEETNYDIPNFNYVNSESVQRSEKITQDKDSDQSRNFSIQNTSIKIDSTPKNSQLIPSETKEETVSKSLNNTHIIHLNKSKQLQDFGYDVISHATREPSPNNCLGFNSEGRPKPPPPPRKASLEQVSNDTKPSRPPPPTRSLSNAGNRTKPSVGIRIPNDKPVQDSVYANIGDIRAAIAPRKPGRTASIRGEDDREKRKAPQPPIYIPDDASLHSQSSSTRMSRRNRSTKGPAPERPFPLPTQTSGECTITVRGNVSPSVENSRTAQGVELLQSIEDQYDAVVTANHQALANTLDQVCAELSGGQFDSIPGTVTSWADLNIWPSQDQPTCGVATFFKGETEGLEVTIMTTPDLKVDTHHLLGPLPIVTLTDHLPSHVLSNGRATVSRHSSVLGTVLVYPPMNLVPMVTYKLSHQGDPHSTISLLILQVVSAFKTLQAMGVEETPPDNVLVVREDEHPRVLVVPPSQQGLGSNQICWSFCRCAVHLTQQLLSSCHAGAGKAVLDSAPRMFVVLVQVLEEDRSGSLSKAKCLLEMQLYGPNLSTGEVLNTEPSLKKWLDRERAALLHTLQNSSNRGVMGVTKVESVLTKFHLLYLVRINLKMVKQLCDIL